jgi:flagellar motor switch protein FliN
MTTEEALIQLADSTAEAIEGVLQMFAGNAIERGASNVITDVGGTLASIDLPGVVASVSYVDGVRGGNVFALPARAARRLAAAMMGEEPVDDDSELTELEISAVGEAMNQMMAGAAMATSAVLGEEVEISVPTTRIVAAHAEMAEGIEAAAHSTSTFFTVCGESARLVQLVPNAFVVRMTRALADLAEVVADPGAGDPEYGISGEALLDVPMRVSVELGSVQMLLGEAVQLAPGTVVELAEDADEPVRVLVNGRPFATARLVVDPEGFWAFRIVNLYARAVAEPVSGSSEHRGGN